MKALGVKIQSMLPGGDYKEPLTEYLPIQRKPEEGKDIEEAPVVTQYEMQAVEDLGLLKWISLVYAI